MGIGWTPPLCICSIPHLPYQTFFSSSQKYRKSIQQVGFVQLIFWASLIQLQSGTGRLLISSASDLLWLSSSTETGSGTPSSTSVGLRRISRKEMAFHSCSRSPSFGALYMIYEGLAPERATLRAAIHLFNSSAYTECLAGLNGRSTARLYFLYILLFLDVQPLPFP